GYDVRVIPPNSREGIGADIDSRTGRVVNVNIPADADVIVLQRVSMDQLAQSIALLRQQKRGVAVVIDMDDDLRAINPANPAFYAMHAKWGKASHTADNARTACMHATLVTVSTPALLAVYAPHGRGVVLPNRVPQGFLDIPHHDSPVLGWPGSTHSHPTDLQVVGPAVARLLREGHTYRHVSTSEGVPQLGVPSIREALQLEVDPPSTGNVDHADWPFQVATIGVGLAPLADTGFNASKSWLKPLEMSATGVPWVASPRAEYARLHRDHQVGVLAKNPREWYRELKRLATDEALREEQSQAGRAAAAANTVEAHAWRWWEAWSDASTTARRDRALFAGSAG
ncbi:MAG: glycosyltransferase, partial [Chromatiaceae bacterium]